MNQFNILNRRAFLSRSFKISMAAALSTLTDIPFVMKRALAEGNIGLPGQDGKIKKILFIWLRFGNDGLNTVVPVQDPQYSTIRPTIAIPAGLDSYATTGPCFDPTTYADVGGTLRGSADNTYSYNSAINLGNSFAALHPSLKFLAPVYNQGDAALIHRVSYPKQSRSHFDSQNYWENGAPGNNSIKDGIFYRAMIESGLAHTSPLTAVSVQTALPLLLRGSEAAMTNLSSPTRYDLLGIPSGTGDDKAFNAMAAANYYPFPGKRSRDLLSLQYQNMSNTLRIFSGLNFNDAGNTFRDNVPTDSDQVWYDGTAATGSPSNKGYYLFPTSNAKNGGYQRPSGGGTNANKYVVPTNHYGFFGNLKAAAMILNKTDAIIAGTELGGFDHHDTEGGVTGQHANLMRSVGWSIYALRKYFMVYADKATWDNTIVVAFSEFGRTSKENGTQGTDHAEAGVMFVAGGGIKGYNQGNPSGVFGCSDLDSIPWIKGPLTTNINTCGTMYGGGFAASASSIKPDDTGYLRRSSDYRSILGEIIRKHLGATQNQLNRIIPGYANSAEKLLGGGTSGIDGVPILGELGLL